MAAGDPERPDRPDYNVYRAGSGKRGRGRRAEQRRSPRERDAAAKSPQRAPGEGPGYTVYRSRRRFARPGTGSAAGALAALRERVGKGAEGRRAGRGAPPAPPSAPRVRPPWRRALRWALIAAGAWLLLSAVLFMVSAQIQKGKLNDQAAEQLGGNPLMVAFPQTILVIGTDARPPGTDEAGAETDPNCLEAAAQGDPPPSSCIPSRADTLMLVRAGGGTFHKLSIPRDTYAEIPGQTAQKINAAYAFGGAELQIKTIEQFLGIDIDHVVILDFQGFADFIDAIGGVTVDLPGRVKSKISGGSANGGVTLKLDRGDNHLDGEQALALARTRKNLWNPSEDDTDRARRQQLILAGIKNRLTSPWRAPINFLRGPWIGWNAPKAMVSDMGGLTIPQLAISIAIAGDSRTRILNPAGMTPSGDLIIAEKQCRKSVRDFLGEAGPRPPRCSPTEAVATAPTEPAPVTPVEPAAPADPVAPVVP